MIHHSKNIDIDAVIAEAEKHKQSPAFIHHCGHSTEWWKLAEKSDYGDIIICKICNQCYLKAKNLPWFIKSRKSSEHASLGIDFTFSARTNHLETSMFYLIEPRIT